MAVDGSGSTDPDGTISGYAWTFGDGGTATGAKASHVYAVAGTYAVTLKVTDNSGATNSLTKSVSVVGNATPTASFTVSASGLATTVDGSPSTDPDGTIATYAWTFGDGATASGVRASHTYAVSGAYSITLTVTDNVGAANSVTKSVTVANAAPVASFTVTTSGLSVSVNGSGSKDADGTIVSYAWTFGDGTTATGVTPSHTYAAAGTYSLNLTVTDNAGAKGSTTQTVKVRSKGPH